MQRETNGDVMLVLALWPDAAPAGPVAIGVSCGAGCGGSVPLDEALGKLAVGQWTTLGVPLKCFARAGADMARLDAVLRLQASGKYRLSMSRVALGALNEAAHTVSCPR